MASHNAPKKPVESSADPLSPYLGPLLLRARQAAGMKQAVVAVKAGLSDASLRKYESGKGSLYKHQIDSICKVLGVNSDLVLLEASTALRCALLERLGRDPELPLYDLQEKRKAALTARHEAERKELEADLDWDNSLYLKQKKFVDRE
jgi:transcriptional regulator with XRE-family HTH domain